VLIYTVYRIKNAISFAKLTKKYINT